MGKARLGLLVVPRKRDKDDKNIKLCDENI